MTRPNPDDAGRTLLAEWPFPTAAALGSRVRRDGIERELRGRLRFPDRKHLAVEDGRIRLRFEAGQERRLADASRVVDGVLAGIDALAVLPREVDDILAILPRERLKWTRDGRLCSAGTRTVTLRGRAKAVTFHVFDPGHVADVMDRDLAAVWRQEDADAAAENRRRAAARAALARAAKATAATGAVPRPRGGARDPAPALREWDAFDAEGLLR